MAYPQQPIVLSSATVTLDRHTHAGTLLVVDRAAGVDATLPASTGGGDKYTFFVKTAVTSNDFTVSVANASDVMSGSAILGQDTADTAVHFTTAASSDTITMNGSTTGGLAGDIVELWDAAENVWAVRIIGTASGTEATPFSAAVS
jgi:hypothetical protein